MNARMEALEQFLDLVRKYSGGLFSDVRSYLVGVVTGWLFLKLKKTPLWTKQVARRTQQLFRVYRHQRAKKLYAKVVFTMRSPSILHQTEAQLRVDVITAQMVSVVFLAYIVVVGPVTDRSLAIAIGFIFAVLVKKWVDTRSSAVLVHQVRKRRTRLMLRGNERRLRSLEPLSEDIELTANEAIERVHQITSALDEVHLNDELWDVLRKAVAKKGVAGD